MSNTSGDSSPSLTEHVELETRPLRCLAFDLDDTLLDTNGRLVPAAAREACQAMIEKGLQAGPAECFVERARFIKREPRGNVYQHLVQTFGVRAGVEGREVSDAGSWAFHHREVERDIALFEGAHELLLKLASKYTLYLVTAGDETTQRQKVELLEIQRFFKRVYFVDPTRGESKRDAFQAILSAEGGAAESFLSIGNRVDSDISPAKELGWKTCWVRTGEYTHMLPSTKEETPDFEVSRIQDLIAACQL